MFAFIYTNLLYVLELFPNEQLCAFDLNFHATAPRLLRFSTKIKIKIKALQNRFVQKAKN